MFLTPVLRNQLLVTGSLGWLSAQLLKVLIDFAMTRSFHPERMVGDGGMPSSHSATVSSLATAALLRYGTGSFEFAICFFLAIIVMHDAMGVRRETGKQAQVLNLLLEENPFEWKGEILEQHLKELVGHSPLQVLIGALLGILTSLVLNSFYV